MKTKQFLKILEEHPNSEVQFEFLPDQFVKANYHITEVKRVGIDSVDCGGQQNAWKETVVQLWVNPIEPNKRSAMKAKKALAIFQRVFELQDFDFNTEIKIEYGSKSFITSQLAVYDIHINPSSLIVKLHNIPTTCKAQETCCSSEEKSKQEVLEVCCS